MLGASSKVLGAGSICISLSYPFCETVLFYCLHSQLLPHWWVLTNIFSHVLLFVPIQCFQLLIGEFRLCHDSVFFFSLSSESACNYYLWTRSVLNMFALNACPFLVFAISDWMKSQSFRLLIMVLLVALALLLGLFLVVLLFNPRHRKSGSVRYYVAIYLTLCVFEICVCLCLLCVLTLIPCICLRA